MCAPTPATHLQSHSFIGAPNSLHLETIASGDTAEPFHRHRWNGPSASVHLQDVKVKMRFGVLAKHGEGFFEREHNGLYTLED